MMLAELVQKGGLTNQGLAISMGKQGGVAEVATVAVATSRINPESNSEGWRDRIDSLPMLREDICFVEERMKQLVSVPQRIQVANQYRNHWQQAAEQQSIDYRKENAGRFAANSYLRKEVDDVDTVH